jgi:hypothetical protein
MTNKDQHLLHPASLTNGVLPLKSNRGRATAAEEPNAIMRWQVGTAHEAAATAWHVTLVLAVVAVWKTV